MRRNRLLLCCALGTLGVALPSIVLADVIQLDANPNQNDYVASLARDQGPANEADGRTTLSMPVSGTQNTAVPNSIDYSNNTYTLNNTGLHVQFTQSQDGLGTGGNLSDAGTNALLTFTPTENVTYSISGTYSTMSGPAGGMTFSAELFQGGLGSSSVLFLGGDENYFSGGASTFDLSGTAGSFPSVYNYLGSSGNATGTLQAGVKYTFWFEADIGGPNEASTAQGSIDFNLSPADSSAAAPLPRSAVAGTVLLALSLLLKHCLSAASVGRGNRGRLA